jgi:acetyl-CoA acetyltransferase family protein
MQKSSSDVYVVGNYRTPFGKRNGYFREKNSVDLLADLISASVKDLCIDSGTIDDFIVGCVDQIGEQSANIARNSWLSAGLSESVPGVTVDRQCGSSLQAIQFGAAGIKADMYNFVACGGVESMTRVPMFHSITEGSTPLSENLKVRYSIEDIWFSQAKAASIIAKKFGITRAEMDILSYESHKRAIKWKEITSKEIIPTTVIDREGVAKKARMDEGIRTDTNLERLNGLRDAFPGIQNITAGNSSQISDGASVTFLASEDILNQYNLEPKAKLEYFSIAGVNPVEMLTGPIPVTKKILQKSKLKVEDIDYFEVNEAFASVVLAWIKEFKVDPEKVNMKGGAIALGHPLGATGSRLVGSMVRTLEEKNAKLGVIAICEGGGMSNGVLVERPE